MSSTIKQIYNQTSGVDTTKLTAEDGKSYLYESEQTLVNSLSSAITEGHDVFSQNFYYNAVTTQAIAKADPTQFHVSAEDAQGLGAQIQTNAAAMLFESMSSSNSVNVLGSLYAANGMVSFLGDQSTYTFQAVA